MEQIDEMAVEAEREHKAGLAALIPEIEAELSAHLSATRNVAGATPDVAGRFVVDSEQAASWVVGKLVALDKREEVLEAQYAAMRKDIENDRAYLNFRLGAELAGWVKMNLPRGKKSVKLLTGTAGFRTSPGRVEIEDQQTVLAWAQKNLPEAIKERIVVDLDKVMIREFIEVKGGKVPGARVSTPEDRFYVKGGA